MRNLLILCIAIPALLAQKPGGMAGVGGGGSAAPSGVAGGVLGGTYPNPGFIGNVTVLPVANGGTGTATPAIVAGTNVAVSGTWPNQTVSATGYAFTGPITVTEAQVRAMYTTPVQIIAAQGAGTVIIPNNCMINAVYGSAAYTGGGVIGLFFDNASPPVNIASTSNSAAFLTSFAANQNINLRAGPFSGGGLFLPSTAIVNKGLYLSNQTAVFAGGTGSSLVVNCMYSVITGVQ